MYFKFEIQFGKNNLISHHCKEIDDKTKKLKLLLKGNCIVCKKKINAPYRRKCCSIKCAIAYDKKRKHRKK